MLSFKSGPCFGRATNSRETKRKTKMLSPFLKVAEELGGVPIQLKPYANWA